MKPASSPSHRGKYKRKGRGTSLQDAGCHKAWDAWNPHIEPAWNVSKGDYWRMGDSLWHPEGSWGHELTLKLIRRCQRQVTWILSQPELVKKIRATGHIEPLLEEAFKRSRKEELLFGTLRRVQERLGRFRLVREGNE